MLIYLIEGMAKYILYSSPPQDDIINITILFLIALFLLSLKQTTCLHHFTDNRHAKPPLNCRSPPTWPGSVDYRLTTSVEVVEVGHTTLCLIRCAANSTSVLRRSFKDVMDLAF